MRTQPSQSRIFQSAASHSQKGGGEQHPVPSLERCCQHPQLGEKSLFQREENHMD